MCSRWLQIQCIQVSLQPNFILFSCSFIQICDKEWTTKKQVSVLSLYYYSRCKVESSSKWELYSISWTTSLQTRLCCDHLQNQTICQSIRSVRLARMFVKVPSMTLYLVSTSVLKGYTCTVFITVCSCETEVTHKKQNHKERYLYMYIDS